MKHIKGFLTFYINFDPEMAQGNIQQWLDLAAHYNKAALDRIRAENYEIVWVATTREASRVEKVDLDMPHPRVVHGTTVMPCERDFQVWKVADELRD